MTAANAATAVRQMTLHLVVEQAERAEAEYAAVDGLFMAALLAWR